MLARVVREDDHFEKGYFLVGFLRLKRHET